MEQLKPLSPAPRTMPAFAQKALRCLGGLSAGLLLSGAGILGIHLPAAVCLIAALGASLPGLSCFLGAAAGCLLLWEPDVTLMTLTAGFLTLVLHWALQDMPLAAKPWFPALSALLPGLLIGILILLSAPVSVKSVLSCCLQVAFLPIGTWAAQNVLEKPTGAPLCAALCALASGSGGLVLGGISLGGILAGGAVFSLTGTQLALPAAILTGLALDWSWRPEVSCSAVLSAAALAVSGPRIKKRSSQLLVFLLVAALVGVLTGGGGMLFLSLLPGCLLARLLPPWPVEEQVRFPEEAARKRLQNASHAMNTVYCQLDDLPAPNQHLEISSIYDKATARVCTTCAGYAACWKQNGYETRQYMLAAAPNIFARRSAKPEDFPEDFQTSCRHFPNLVAAITGALEQDAERRQRDHFRREMRTVLGSQYRILSDFLRLNVLPKGRENAPQFRAETACLARGRKNAPVSGDRCTALAVGETQFLLLCDGMGTGAEAAAESGRAVGLLTQLLKAGMSPDDALETLGALAILREDGGFCALDLAWVSLVTGEGGLYKWGGGPSYLVTAESIKKLGTATVPPGLGVGGTQMAQQIRLSLRRGEVLILTSDGVDGEDVLRQLRSGTGLQAKDLAAEILDTETSEGEDDRSAAVLKLHPVSAR